MLGGRNQHGIYVFKGESVFEVLKRPRGAAIILRIRGNRLFAIHAPQVANGCHLRLVAGLQLGGDPIQIVAAAAVADVA